MYFKVTIESGYIETERACETQYYVEADSTVELFTIIENYIGLKSRGRGETITMVKPVNEQEYEIGKVVVWKREYIKHLPIWLLLYRINFCHTMPKQIM
ncbi:MAG: hypothetical protein RQ824_07160 [bacterium]|nr:hypothetical protein [bacterium]